MLIVSSRCWTSFVLLFYGAIGSFPPAKETLFAPSHLSCGVGLYRNVSYRDTIRCCSRRRVLCCLSVVSAGVNLWRQCTQQGLLIGRGRWRFNSCMLTVDRLPICGFAYCMAAQIDEPVCSFLFVAFSCWLIPSARVICSPSGSEHWLMDSRLIQD